MSGVLFLAVLSLFPETRFERVLKLPLAPTVAAHSDDAVFEKNAASLDVEHLEENQHTSPKTTSVSYFQMLKLFSGTPKESILSILVRSAFMLAYPAVLWTIIGCKSSASFFILSQRKMKITDNPCRFHQSRLCCHG